MQSLLTQTRPDVGQAGKIERGTSPDELFPGARCPREEQQSDGLWVRFRKSHLGFHTRARTSQARGVVTSHKIATRHQTSPRFQWCGTEEDTRTCSSSTKSFSFT